MQGVYRGMALALVAIFLASVARFYHPTTGFTALIAFPDGNDSEAPALQDLPHERVPPWASYDGQFYAQRALDPLARDPRVDRAMDLAPYRARRILFSWTAYVLGLGRPAWILEAFALQNVAAWLILAILVTRWLPLRSGRHLALWTACLFSHGLLWSVRFALLDGPSLVLTALAIVAAERERWILSACVVGVNGLGRETNVLGVFAQAFPARPREWLRLACAAVIVVLPLLIWEDYLYSIYRSTIFAGGDQLTMPGSALVSTVGRALSSTVSSGVFSASGRAAGHVALAHRAGRLSDRAAGAPGTLVASRGRIRRADAVDGSRALGSVDRRDHARPAAHDMCFQYPARARTAFGIVLGMVRGGQPASGGVVQGVAGVVIPGGTEGTAPVDSLL